MVTPPFLWSKYVMAKLQIVKTTAELRNVVHKWRQWGKTVALVPTMGALHEGHLSLVRMAKQKAHRTVVSIFVNPTQFSPNEDFAAYPRDEERDQKLLSKAKVDLLYIPNVESMYAEDFSSRVEVIGFTSRLEGASRPHHFSGVTTVVTKFFMRCLPDIAVFGEKDYQQLMVIRQMTRDLDIPIEILGAPTVREADGLAMSSRNAYLSQSQRAIAPKLYAVLQEVAQNLSSGQLITETLSVGCDCLADAGFRIDYLELYEAETFLPVEERTVTVTARLLAAVYLGRRRLIDNVPVSPATSPQGG
jgi:pantoate--beta-alanine ligase